MEKRYNARESEQQLQELWQQERIYHFNQQAGPLYTIDTPPPTVSGALHIGHIFSYTQTDIIARYKRMRGFAVFYPFGFDDNGLPTERYIEKKLKVRPQDVGRDAFIKLCLEAVQPVEKEFEDLWKSMGLSVDWQLQYATIAENVRRLSQESFLELLQKGYAYRRFEPALYCTTCQTSVAQAELDNEERPSFFNDIAFSDLEGKPLIVGTTRPELLPSCVALLYNPADDRHKHLLGKKARVPLYDYEVPIIESEKVAIDKGTGLVMCCTFGDKTDIEWYKEFNLPYKPSMNAYGKWLPETGILANLKATAARERVLEELKNQGLLLTQKPITHHVNLHERCKNEIEYLALPQWFLKILDHKQQLLDLADQITWYPAFMKSRYKDWVSNLGWDWCLSRQRFYGIPFPVWHCSTCHEIIPAHASHLPIDPQTTNYPGGSCPACGSTALIGDRDVMDTWNTSSLTPQICYELFAGAQGSAFADEGITKQFLPMGMRPQAHDIIRTWAFYTIIKSWMHHGSIPWNDIVISGHVLSNQNKKLSKSQDNANITPQNLLVTYSADVIRYWTASASIGHDVAFSETQLKIGQKLVTKLWNAYRFIHEHLDMHTSHPFDACAGTVMSEWILHQFGATHTTYVKYFDAYEPSLALNALETFFWNDFCDTYLETVKDQLFHPEKYDTLTVRSTKATLYHVGMRMLQLFAPYVPFVTDALYRQVYQSPQSLHLTRFEEFTEQTFYPDSAQKAAIILEIGAKIRKLKTVHQLALRTELTTLTINVTAPEVRELVLREETLIKGITNAHTIVLADASASDDTLTPDAENVTAVACVSLTATLTKPEAPAGATL